MKPIRPYAPSTLLRPATIPADGAWRTADSGRRRATVFALATLPFAAVVSLPALAQIGTPPKPSGPRPPGAPVQPGAGTPKADPKADPNAPAKKDALTPEAEAPMVWQIAGRAHAKNTIDHDSLTVRAPFDTFRRIKFKVTDAPLNLRRIVVTYDRGEPDRIEVRQQVRQGGESRPIELRNRDLRRIRRIDFWYDIRGIGQSRAEVVIYGMR